MGKIVHKLAKTPIYNTWKRMRQRCYNKNNPDYKYYGGRGITISKEWDKYENFYNDMIDGYEKVLTLDRIDNNGNYCKENCRWATRMVQSNNRNYVTQLNCLGHTGSIAKLSREFNIKENTVRSRIRREKWSLEKALTTPLVRVRSIK